MTHRRKTCAKATSLGLVALVIATPALGQQAPYYVLDGFGGVHAGGGAPATAGTPYFGFDIARGVAYVPGAAGNGILVLDGFGGVHRAGLGPVTPSTPYFGFNIARAIAYRNVPPRVAGGSSNQVVDLGTVSSSLTVIQTLSITAPDDGFLLIVASSYLGCRTDTETDFLLGFMSMNVDSTLGATALGNLGIVTWPDCTFSGGIDQTQNQTLTHLFPVSAGAHTVNLLARKSGGSPGASIRILSRSLTALFIDHDAVGNS